MRLTVVAAALGLLWPIAASGAGIDLKAELRATAGLLEGRRLTDAGRYADAVAVLEPAARDDPGDADVHNELGFALRKSGRLDEAQARYDRALAIDPAHREAREYLGELHLQRGDLARAREQLATLDRLCPTGCEERDELREAIEAHGGR
jgi:Flp pilus assembly protein TadD